MPNSAPAGTSLTRAVPRGYMLHIDTDQSLATLTFDLVSSAAPGATMIDLTRLPASSGFKIQGDLTADQAGRSAASAGEVRFATLIFRGR